MVDYSIYTPDEDGGCKPDRPAAMMGALEKFRQLPFAQMLIYICYTSLRQILLVNAMTLGMGSIVRSRATGTDNPMENREPHRHTGTLSNHDRRKIGNFA
ncbi:hypothetical protein [Rubidibacter lacunae]|uniref:hypothetical protein n=1 Tax=Rubidibacter lacunae TaxID=582514 RepID=UPI00058F6ECF|nr:hypothetical protein [Rubidibacter lacunae]